MLYLPCNYMEQGGNKHHKCCIYPVTTWNKEVTNTLIYSPQMLYLPCNYMEQGGNKHFNLQPTNVVFTL